MAPRVHPDDLHVEQVDNRWVVRTSQGSEIASYSNQKMAWYFAQQTSGEKKVDAFLHSKEGTIRDQVTHRPPAPFSKMPTVPVIVVLGAVLAIIGFYSLRSSPQSNGNGQPGYESVAQGLAVIDEGESVAPDDPITLPYQDALDTLRSSVCGVPEKDIADMVVSARNRLSGKGVSTTALQILEETNQVALIAPDPAAVAVSLGLPDATNANDQCALYVTAAILKLEN